MLAVVNATPKRYVSENSRRVTRVFAPLNLCIHSFWHQSKTTSRESINFFFFFFYEIEIQDLNFVVVLKPTLQNVRANVEAESQPQNASYRQKPGK